MHELVEWGTSHLRLVIQSSQPREPDNSLESLDVGTDACKEFRGHAHRPNVTVATLAIAVALAFLAIVETTRILRLHSHKARP